MKYKLCMIAIVALTIMWGCSSGDDSSTPQPQPQPEPEQPEPQPQVEYSVFTESDYPDWAINWKWLNAVPDWKEPEPNQYRLSMQIQVELEEGLAFFSTDADKMAVFMGGTCRGLSKRSVLEQDGKVVFLLNIEGDEQEIGSNMELRYFNAQLTHIFTNKNLPPFEPDNLWGDKYDVVQKIGMGSAKYPYSTKLTVVLPEELPFKANNGDCVYVFVGKDCRGVFKTRNENAFSGYVFSNKKEETAEIRYYSVDKQGYYTIKETFILNNDEQTVSIKF